MRPALPSHVVRLLRAVPLVNEVERLAVVFHLCQTHITSIYILSLFPLLPLLFQFTPAPAAKTSSPLQFDSVVMMLLSPHVANINSLMLCCHITESWVPGFIFFVVLVVSAPDQLHCTIPTMFMPQTSWPTCAMMLPI